MKKYPDFIEIRHAYQPLRGFILDEETARMNTDEFVDKYKKEELNRNIRVFYEIYDKEWVLWLQKVFWNIYRSSIPYNQRLKQFNEFF